MTHRAMISLASACLLAAFQGTAYSQSGTSLPTPETKRAIESLPISPRASGTDLRLRDWMVDPKTLPPSSRDRVKSDASGAASVPIVASDSVIIQFEPNASAAAIESFLKSRELPVLQTFPSIGAVEVQTDLSKYIKPELGDNNSNDSLIRGMLSATKSLEADAVVKSAVPNLVLQPQSAEITNVLTPSDVFVAQVDDEEVTDWGISDIGADQLWLLPGANDGAILGVMDTGFKKHQDIVFLELAPKIDVDNHGNHVAGIACGRHNGKGVRGVVPNCFIRAKTADVFFKSAQPGDVTRFLVTFSQILATLTAFVDRFDDVSTFNVSLGYNWRSNFGINPDLPESSTWRSLVEMQGLLLVPLLELAQQRDKVIFSAAGNDSSGLAVPIGAKYASPFNWAASVALERGVVSGVVVEAHDSQGMRATFSNSGGKISCPGVNIMSALANGPGGIAIDSTYGRMSGTSMASPYCAGGYVLFRLVRPNYSSREAIECLLKSDRMSSSGVPTLRLAKAVEECP